jgi:hypothetical protein
MALNNSGPLSFGGSTVGQSINLELGLSATATASINSTAFRTLAGVPSGQISISNFYGKSNTIGWVAYIGLGNTAAGLFLNGGLFVDALSNVYWCFSQTTSSYFGIARISSSGTSLTFIYPFFEKGGRLTGGSTRSSTASVAALPFNPALPVLYGATLNRVYPGTVNNATTDMERASAAIMSDNSLVRVGSVSTGYYTGTPAITKFNSAGTSAVSYNFASTSTNQNSVVIRTDGGIVHLWRTSASLFMYPFNSALSPGGTRYSFTQASVPDSGLAPRACIDDSNNIFVATRSANFIERYNSSYTQTHRVSLNSTPFGNGFEGIAVQGGSVYVIAHAFGFIYVTSLSSSDLSMQWTNRFSVSSYTAATFAVNETQSLYATAEGVFFGMQNGGGIPGFLVKIPLTGMPSDSSVAVAGSGRTLSWDRPVYTRTVQSTNPTTTAAVTPTSVTPRTETAINAGSSITPTATKTDIV